MLLPVVEDASSSACSPPGLEASGRPAARVICERARALPSPRGDGEASALYELSHESERAAVNPSRGPWQIVVRYSHVATLEQQLLAADAGKFHGLLPLSRFAPARFGATARADVITERSRGLCKFLKHVLKVTEPGASPPRLAAILDDFVARHSTLLAEPDPFDVSSSAACAHEVGFQRFAALRDGPGRGRLGEARARVHEASHMLELIPSSDLRPAASPKGLGKKSEARPAADAWPLRSIAQCVSEARPSDMDEGCAEVTALPGLHGTAATPASARLDYLPWRQHDVEHFVEQVALSDCNTNGICGLCGEHLQRTEARLQVPQVPSRPWPPLASGAVPGATEAARVEASWNAGRLKAGRQLKGIVRLRSCGHELHSVCFVDLVRGRRPAGRSRMCCPECGENWLQWADASARTAPTLLTAGTHLVASPGRGRTTGDALLTPGEHGERRREHLSRSEWFAMNPVQACRPSEWTSTPSVQREKRRLHLAPSEWLPAGPERGVVTQEQIGSVKALLRQRAAAGRHAAPVGPEPVPIPLSDETSSHRTQALEPL